MDLSNRALQILIVLLALMLYGAGIWSTSILTQGDESDYIRSSQEMLASGDYLTPTFRNQLRFTKPPLLYWMLVASYDVFGVNYFASRFPTVLCSILSVIFVFRMGLTLFDKKAALIAASMTATTFGMIKFSKIALMESPLILTLLLAFYYFARFYKEDKNSHLLWSFVFIGLSSLLKSPVYSVLTVGVMTLFLLLQGELQRFYRKEFVFAGVLGIMIAAPWYIAMIVMHGSIFTDFYLNEHINKFEAEPHYLFRVWVGLLLYLLPWTFYCIYATAATFSKSLYKKWSYKLLLITIGMFLLIFLLPNQKGHYYSIPLIPYCGLLIGGVLSQGLKTHIVWECLTALVLVIAGIVFIAAALLLDSGKFLSMAAAICVIAAAILLIRHHDTIIPCLLVGLSMLLFYVNIIPALNLEIIPVNRTLQIARDKPLYSYNLSPLKFADSLGRNVAEVLEPDDLHRLLDNGGVVIITDDELSPLKPTLKDDVKVVLEWKRWRRRLAFKKVFEAMLTQKTEEIQQSVYLIAK